MYLNASPAMTRQLRGRNLPESGRERLEGQGGRGELDGRMGQSGRLGDGDDGPVGALGGCVGSP